MEGHRELRVLGIGSPGSAEGHYLSKRRLSTRRGRPERGYGVSHWRRAPPLVPARVRDEPELIRLGFQAAGPDSVERLVARSRRLGPRWPKCLRMKGSTVRSGSSIQRADPRGLSRDVRGGGTAPVCLSGLHMLLHAVVQVPDPLASTRFLRRGPRVPPVGSDRGTRRLPQGRQRYHHSIALARGGRTKLDHVAVHVHGLDDVMRVRSHGMATGTLSDDVVRHTASGSISVYLRDEVNDLGVEFCTQHAIIDDIDYRGRVLVPSRPRSTFGRTRSQPASGARPDSCRRTRGATDAARTAIGPVSRETTRSSTSRASSRP